jgi:hypothetical protein
VATVTVLASRREKGCLYVDKTEYLYKLSRLDGVFYSISRPRWFGVSLAMQALELMYRGKRDAFRGLYIDGTDYEWTSHPVLNLNFLLASEDPGAFRRLLEYELKREAEKYGIALSEAEDCRTFYRNAIRSLSRINKVVVLIDEFDKPLRVNAANGKLGDFLTIYRDFFSALEESRECIELSLVFSTTPLPEYRLSPVLDRFINLTFSDDYAAFFGFTQKEIEEYFALDIERGMAAANMGRREYLEKMYSWFGGYRFSPNGEGVYHPGFISRFFGSEGGGVSFRNYWVMIGRIGDVIRERAASVDFDFALDRTLSISQSSLQSKDITDLSSSFASKEDFIALLYWYGYFTVNEAVEADGDCLLTLGYTNQAMEDNLENLVLEHYSPELFQLTYRISRLLDASDAESTLSQLINYLSSIPYSELEFSRESLCHSVFYYVLRHLGAEDIVLKNGAEGFSIEGTVECPEDIYLIRIDFDNSALNAADTIKNSRDIGNCRREGKRLHVIGLDFIPDDILKSEWKEFLMDDGRHDYI